MEQLVMRHTAEEQLLSTGLPGGGMGAGAGGEGGGGVAGDGGGGAVGREAGKEGSGGRAVAATDSRRMRNRFFLSLRKVRLAKCLCLHVCISLHLP